MQRLRAARNGGRHASARAALYVATIVVAALVVAACASRAGAPEEPTRALPGETPSATAATTATSASATPQAASATATAPSPSTATAAGSITIDAVGDISLARGVVDKMQAEGAAYPLALVSAMLDGDINVANLEGALTERGEPWPKGYNFRTPPRFASALTAGHFGVVTLANNHTMDFGPVGLNDTVEALDAAGVQHAGAGTNDLAAHLPALVEVRGLRVAFLGYVATPDEGGGFRISSWAPGVDTPGVAIAAPDRVAMDVAAARRVADFVIVLLHAGDEYRTSPNDTQRQVAAAALAAGADAYIGAHAHVPQGIERRGNQLVAWGLGNFVFALDNVDLANIPEPRVAPILKLTLTKGVGVTAYEVAAVTLDASQDRPRPATPAEAAVLATTTR